MEGGQEDYSGTNQEGYGYYDQSANDSSYQIRDLEEKQKFLKDRLILVGQNLIETREKTHKDSIEIKKNLELLKQDVERIKSFLDMVSKEMQKFARKEDLDILAKQAKMFQPLEFVRKKDLKKVND